MRCSDDGNEWTYSIQLIISFRANEIRARNCGCRWERLDGAVTGTKGKSRGQSPGSERERRSRNTQGGGMVNDFHAADPR